jgi:ATP-binding cassette subfamily C protein CydD
LQGLATLKVFDRSRPESATLARASEEYRQRTMGVLRIAFLSSAVLELFGSLAIALVAVYLGLSFLGYLNFGHYDRPLTLETGLFILLLAPEYYQTLRQLGTHYHARAEALGAAGEILAVLSVPSPPRPLGAASVPQASAGVALRFEDVQVGFEDRRRVALTGFSLDVAAGERVALVGPSGAGKTTTLNLLLGLLRPDRGRILVNGLDLASLDPQAWRCGLSWVGQHPTLFYGTLRDNILLGRPDAAPREVERAARAAQVWEIAAALPQGLDSVVGERGIGLSGGQIQCVALARALLRDDAPLVLLDEPTASLDRERERRVLAALEALTRGRTVILATHRQSAARLCDRVVVLEEGRLARNENPGGEPDA